MDKSTIMLNKMYVGEYLSRNNNIGHEVINLIKTDFGENYISAMPYSKIPNNKRGKVKTVLLIRPCNSNLVEILAKAEVEDVPSLEHYEQIQYIRENNIIYGNKFLDKIYQNNNNEYYDNSIFITFKVTDLKRVKPYIKLFIINSEKYIELNSDNRYNVFLIKNTDLRMRNFQKYFTKEDESNGYKTLQSIIDNENFWEKENTTKQIAEVKPNPYKYNNFIDIVDKQYAELTYSNLFSHIFKSDTELFSQFAKEVLFIEDMSKNITVAREQGHIDLLINDSENVIVIENKIKSDLHNIRYDSVENKIKSQLDDYYEQISKNDKYKNSDKYFYLFVSDYNRINKTINIYNDKCSSGKIKYKIIPYSKIYEFFSREDIYKKYSGKIPYYNEFLYAIQKHINETNNNLEIEMLNRFILAINSQR